jgi:glycosyltransferase involved in cell wall biosynthesis
MDIAAKGTPDPAQPVDQDATIAPVPTSPRPRRVAFLSYSTAEFDSRTLRMARSAVDAGYEVVIYALWRWGLPATEEQDGFRIVRVAHTWYQGLPGLGSLGRWSAARRMRRALARMRARGVTAVAGASPTTARSAQPDLAAPPAQGARGLRRAVATSSLGPLARRVRSMLRWRPTIRIGRRLMLFPIKPMGWGDALEAVAEPADIWHGMWAGSLPGLARLRKRHGGRTIYDSRDIYLHARDYDRLNRAGKAFFRAIEGRWARAADAVLTVNDAYADILVETLGVDRPAVVMNCPARWTPPEPRPDHLRTAMSLPASTRVVLYQGNLLTDRGIEQSMDAILDVPEACLAVMGYGKWTPRYREAAEREPYRGHVFVLPAVPPADLLEWTASADVLVVAIQPTTLNHRLTTPQKLFEAMAAGVPVVASDMPGMAGIVRETGSGVLVDPTSPGAIAAGLRSVLDRDPAERRQMADRALAAAHDRYNWETQVETLLALYERLLGRPS